MIPRRAQSVTTSLATLLAVVGCVVQGPAPSNVAPSFRSHDRSEGPPREPSARESQALPLEWSSLTPHAPVVEPFGGDGNQFIFSITAYGDGFVAVGEDLSFDGPVNGAIWWSANGSEWARLPTRPNGLANAEIHSVATSGARLIALGGSRQGASDGVGDATIIRWISDDGQIWSRDAPDAGELFDGLPVRSLAGGPDGFVAWGLVDRDSVLFHSPDGSAWSRVDDSGVFHGARVSSITSFRGGFVAVGSVFPPPGDIMIGGPDRSTAIAWWSSDGRTWKASTIDPGRGLQSVQAGATGLLATGSGECGGCVGPAALWHSDDGRLWRRVGDDVSGWPAYGSDGTRIIRDDWQGSGGVFESFDGATWEKVGRHPRAEEYGLTVGPHGIVITMSVAKREPTDETDAAVQFLAAN